MSNFQSLVLRALAAILYCLVFKDNEVLLRQGHDKRQALILKLVSAADDHA